jgi:hypothetical protein
VSVHSNPALSAATAVPPGRLTGRAGGYDAGYENGESQATAWHHPPMVRNVSLPASCASVGLYLHILGMGRAQAMSGMAILVAESSQALARCVQAASARLSVLLGVTAVGPSFETGVFGAMVPTRNPVRERHHSRYAQITGAAGPWQLRCKEVDRDSRAATFRDRP